jgi:hypothetical protein
MNRIEELEEVIIQAIKAWQKLPGGQRNSVQDTEKWLIKEMGPAINKLRKSVNVKIPKSTEDYI